MVVIIDNPNGDVLDGLDEKLGCDEDVSGVWRIQIYDIATDDKMIHSMVRLLDHESNTPINRFCEMFGGDAREMAELLLR